MTTTRTASSFTASASAASISSSSTELSALRISGRLWAMRAMAPCTVYSIWVVCMAVPSRWMAGFRPWGPGGSSGGHDGFLLRQRLDLGCAVAGLLQDFARVLTEARRQAADAGGARGETRRRARLADRAFGWMLQVAEHADRLQVRLVRDLGQLRE